MAVTVTVVYVRCPIPNRGLIKDFERRKLEIGLPIWGPNLFMREVECLLPIASVSIYFNRLIFKSLVFERYLRILF